MDKAIARLNIEYFQKKLATERDESKRRLMLQLLAEEEAKLAALTNDPPQRKSGRA